MYPGRRVARILFTVVALSMVLYMCFLWEEKYRENQITEKQADIVTGNELDAGGSASSGISYNEDGRLFNADVEKDSTLSQEEKEERRCEIPGLTDFDVHGGTLSNGMTWKQREALEKIPGVKRVVGETIAHDMKLAWERAPHSSFRNNFYLWKYLSGTFSSETVSELAPGEFDRAYAIIPNDLSLYEYTIYGLEKSEEVDRQLSATGREYDSEAFWSGNQGILFALQPEAEWFEDDGDSQDFQGILFYDKKRKAYRFQGKEGEAYQFSFEENSIDSGEEIRILDSRKNQLLSTKVVVSTDMDCYRRILESVSQMYSEDGNGSEFGPINILGGYCFIGSRNLMKRIQEKTEKSLTDQVISIWLEDRADREKAEKKISKLLSQYEWRYQSNLEVKSSARDALVRQRMISLSVILLVLICYYVIMQTMERREMEQIRGRLQLLLQQGAWKRDILRVRASFHARGYLWGILAIPLCCLWQGVGKWSSYLQSVQEEEEFLGEQETGFAAFAKELLPDFGDYLGNPWQWGILLLFVLGVLAFTLFAEWRYLKKLKLYDN